MQKYTKKEFDKLLRSALKSESSTELSEASLEQVYRAMAMVIRQIMSDNHKIFLSRTLGAGHKQVY